MGKLLGRSKAVAPPMPLAIVPAVDMSPDVPAGAHSPARALTAALRP